MTEERQEQERREKEKLERKQQLNDIRRIIQTPEGMRFFRRLLESGKMFTSSFTGNSTTYLNEGRRSIALEFWADIVESSPDYMMALLVPNPVPPEEE